MEALVGDDPHDSPARAPEAELLTERISVGKEPARRRLINQSDGRSEPVVGFAQTTPPHQR